MIKRIYSYIMLVAGALMVLVSCDKGGDEIKTYSTLVDVTNSSLSDHKYNMAVRFSTDGGTTFVEYPVIKQGQSYKVKVLDLATGEEITAANCYNLDWSASTPKPVGEATSDVAEFVMKESNQIKVAVTDNVTTPYDAASWAGTFSAVEDYGASGTYGPYDVVLTQDASNPNRFHLDNFYDSGLAAYIDFDGPNFTVSFPDGQTPNGKPITNSSGTFNQCRGTAIINLNYDGGDWVYRLTKQ
ncbi:MAG TPA: hypothetical protein VF490_19100 [Chryseosolibacter sp.]